MLTTPTTSSWLFPPQTSEVQFDEKWAFVAKKQKNCDPANPADAHKGDWWDHVAYDPEHRLVLAVIPGSRTIENAEAIVAEVKQRLGGRPPGVDHQRRGPGLRLGHRDDVRRAGASRRPAVRAVRRIVPQRRLPEGLNYATVHKERAQQPGGCRGATTDLRDSQRRWRGHLRGRRSVGASTPRSWSGSTRRTVAAMRGRRGRTYRFSKDWRVHEAMTYFTLYSDNFCWTVRTLQHPRPGRPLAPADAGDGGGVHGSCVVTRRMATFPNIAIRIGHHRKAGLGKYKI